MPSIKWFGLDTERKAIWDRLEVKAKSSILGYTNPGQSRQHSLPTEPFGKPTTGKPNQPPFKAQVNLHEISAYNFLQDNMHDVDPSVTDHDSG